MLTDKLSFFSKKIQKDLFPLLEEELNQELLDSHKHLIEILEIIQIEKTLPEKLPFERGRPTKNRHALARAFLAKHTLNLPSTNHLIYRLKCDKQLRYICGWQPGEKIQSEATFSRMFSFLSENQILDSLHEKLVKDTLDDESVLHCSRDSVPIEVREREEKKDKTQKFKRYRFKDKNGKKLTLCEYQATEAQTLEEMVKHLKTDCDIGRKTNPGGTAICWRGLKLHMDVANGRLPLSCILTSASTHDSQVAIPLSRKTSSRSTVLYELMDSAYDVTSIKEFITEEGRVPLIRIHKRKGKRKALVEANEKAHRTLRWYPPEERRLQHRFSSERLFARLKDSFLCHKIYVRGIKKVSCHVLLGVLCLFASEVLRI